jgi:UDP-2-acetamido-2-deoxy-ribo-hexuluronate aminotransferase
MVDLQGQYEKIKSEIDTAIQEVLDSTHFIKGPQLINFQKALGEYLHIPHVIACANGTDALQIALMSLDLKQGDEVITSPFTFIATVEVIKLLGLKPVFCDVDPDHFNLDPDKLEALINPATKAIIPVHLFGQCTDMNRINEIAKRHKLFIIEDAAQSLGSEFYPSSGGVIKAGTIGHIGCTSFFPSKNLGAFGDGGAIFTHDDLLAEKIKSIANHGMKEKYVYEYTGVNSRLDTLQAAILLVKLRKLDEYNKARKIAAEYYDRKLHKCKFVIIPSRVPWSDHIFHQYTIKVKPDLREGLKLFLEKRGIPSMIYYPSPLHTQTAYKDLGYKTGDFPVAEELCTTVLSLPMHTELGKDQLEYISEAVLSYFNCGT